jgi:hypothetical protein
VVRLWRMMRSTTARIVRRSSSCGRVASVMVVLLKPASNQGPNLVSKVREDKRRQTALVRKQGEARAYRNRCRLPSVSARLGSRLRAARRGSFYDFGWKMSAGGRGLYRREGSDENGTESMD